MEFGTTKVISVSCNGAREQRLGSKWHDFAVFWGIVATSKPETASAVSNENSSTKEGRFQVPPDFQGY